MDYLLSVNVITKCLMLISALALVLFTCLERLAGFLRLSKPRTPTGVDSNTKLDPPREDNAPTRDPDYYYHATTVVLRIQNTLFRVHEDFISSEPNALWSKIRRSRFQRARLDGSSDARAVVIDDIPITEFRALLYYFYHERTHMMPTRETKVEYLCEILAGSHRIEMAQVRSYAVQQLRDLQPPLSPIRRVILCQRYSLPRRVWLYPAVSELLERVEPPNPDDAPQVGSELFQKITTMREALARSGGNHGFTQAQLVEYLDEDSGHTLVPSLTLPVF